MTGGLSQLDAFFLRGVDGGTSGDGLTGHSSSWIVCGTLRMGGLPGTRRVLAVGT
jgi:hypothetical protein